MKSYTLWAVAVLIAAAVGLALLPSRPSAAQGSDRQRGFGILVNRHIIVLKEGAADAAEVAADLARQHRLTLGPIFRRALVGFVATVPPSALAALRRDPRVAYVERDQRYRTFAPFPIPSGIDRIDADLSPTAKIDSVEDPPIDIEVAILDTGIQRDHPDLNVIGGRNFATFGAPDPLFDDLNGHGTHVAGTVAARDNGPDDGDIHVVGVAPGARVWAVRVLDRDGSSWTSWVLQGVEWLTDTSEHPPFDVANMSLGGGASRALDAAVERAVASGVTVLVAAGNESRDCRNTSPANTKSAGVITVSALADSDGKPGGSGQRSLAFPARDDTFASFSNYGAGEDGVDLMAPGVDILSTWLGGRYRRLSGTSMATPHVTGAAALYLARSGGSPADVKSGLLSAAKNAESVEGYAGGTRDRVREPLLFVGGF
jgi:subtilisin family serine protease